MACAGSWVTPPNIAYKLHFRHPTNQKQSTLCSWSIGAGPRLSEAYRYDKPTPPYPLLSVFPLGTPYTFWLFLYIQINCRYVPRWRIACLLFPRGAILGQYPLSFFQGHNSKGAPATQSHQKERTVRVNRSLKARTTYIADSNTAYSQPTFPYGLIICRIDIEVVSS